MTIRHDVRLLSDEDLYLFNEGRHFRLYEKLGSHPLVAEDGTAGTYFAVWAPNARSVSVIGDWNGWNPAAHGLAERGVSGVWEGFLPGVGPGNLYKYHLVSHHRGYQVDKADPFAFSAEVAPGQASRVTELSYGWSDDSWLERRAQRQCPEAPVSVYELHLGSWKRPHDGRAFHNYRELAPLLVEHLHATGFTHVELMPIMEHPFYGSWGYQCTGYFAATSRYGSPQDLMYLIDYLHREGFGVLLDWVPSHFPTDEHGLGFFDGTHLFEHADPRTGFHPDWGSFIFNYGRHEVVSFLVSSGLFWLDRYHADGLRVDAVASMLYLDYSREEGQWIPNRWGGRENLEAIEFLKVLNQEVHTAFPGTLTVAEESTAWPQVTGAVDHGGLGFDLKWDMGWMHDTLRYLGRPPIYRKFHHRELTFRGLYAHSERYCLSLSHDEVVHGKRSLLDRMPGDAWQMRANLRLLLAAMAAQPGKKLLFMGGEIGQWWEWSHEGELHWYLLADPAHEGIRRAAADLNRIYRDLPALHRGDCRPEGFEWIDADDADHSILALLRRDPDGPGRVAVVLNFTPVVRGGYRLGLPEAGRWREILNTDAEVYGGSGVTNPGDRWTDEVSAHGRPVSLQLTLPPLGATFLFREGGD